MACYLKCKLTPNWINDEYEWSRRLHEGQFMTLGKKDLPFGLSADGVDEEQVLCTLDMSKKVVMVKRVGAGSSRDSWFKEIGLGQTVEIRDGQWFSIGGTEDGVHVSFVRDENESDEDLEKGEGLPGEIYYKAAWYDSRSHSLIREKIRNGDYDDDEENEEQMN